MRAPFCSLLGALLTSLLPLAACAAGHQVDVGFTMIRDPAKPNDTQPRLEVIRIGLLDAAGEEDDGHLLRTDSPAILDSRRFKLKQNGKPAGFSLLLKNVRNGTVSAVFLVPEKSLKATEGVTLEMVQEAGAAPGFQLTNGETIGGFGPLALTPAPKDLEFLNRNKAVQTNFAVLGGKDGSSAAVKLAYGLDSFSKAGASTDRFWRFQSMVDADVSYKPKKNRDYVNSINGEADFVLAQYFEAPRLGGLRGLYETGLAGRFESDQLFDKINLTVGWTHWLSLNAPRLDKFATGLCLLGKPEAAVPPILVFSYDYVSPIRDDLPAGNRGEETGRNRLRGRFDWSLALAHDADFVLVHHYDADLLIDVGAIYDFESGKTMPDVRLSLDIGPIVTDTTAPRFTLSYVNGQTTPTFRNYNALLAGFKLPF